MKIRRAAALGLLAALPASAAFASDEDCAVVAKAMLAGGSQPGSRQTHIHAETAQPLGLSLVMRPDATYIREAADAPWRKFEFGTAERTRQAEETLKAIPVVDCSKLAPETVRGVATEVYAYSQTDPTSPGEKLTGRIWIGPDGLPIRMLMTPTSALDFEYGDFPAP